MLVSNFLFAQADNPGEVTFVGTFFVYAFFLFIYWVIYKVVSKIYQFIKIKLKS